MNLDTAKFSVLLPILDREDIVKGFPLALESIYSNTLIPDQVVVTIDGKVSEKFREIIINLKQRYALELVWAGGRVGLDKALNMGIEKCRNKFIFRADGDDINLKERFEIQLPFLLQGYDVVGSYIDEYDEKGNYLSTRQVPISNKEILRRIVFRNPMNHMTVGFRKETLLAVAKAPPA